MDHLKPKVRTEKKAKKTVEYSRPRYFIQSVENGLMILQSFASRNGPLSLSEVARIVGKNLPTTSRFLRTFVDLDYLVMDRTNKRYSLTPKVTSLGLSYLNNLDLRSRANPHAISIAKDFNVSTQCAILDGIEIILVARIRGEGFVDFNLAVGSRLPAYCTASGRAILANLEPARMRELIDQMELRPRTSFTITDKDELLVELERTRERGYGQNIQEITIGYANISVPIFNNGEVEGAIAASFPLESMNKKEYFDELLEKLLEAGQKSSLQNLREATGSDFG